MSDRLRWIGDPPIDYPPGLFAGLFPDHGALLISGGKEVGKTLVALEINHSAVTGEPLWGQLKPTRTVEKAVYIFAEHGGFPSIAQLWADTGLEDPDHRIQVCDIIRPLVSNGARYAPGVEFYKKVVAGAQLVTFDPLGAFLQGAEAENQAIPARAVINAMEEIAYSTHAAPMILGHFGKLIYLPDTGESVHSGTRGSSALEHAATGVWYLSQGRIGEGFIDFKLKKAFFKGFPLPDMTLRRPDDMLGHVLQGDPAVSRVRAIAGRKGGRASGAARRSARQAVE